MGDNKSALDALREKINVTSVNAEGTGIGQVNDGAEDNEDAGDENEAGDDDSGNEQGGNESGDAGTTQELGDAEEGLEESEERQEELEEEQRKAKTQKEKDRVQRKINREIAKRKELEDQIADLKAQLDAKNAEAGDTMTKADAEKLAKDIAAETVNENEFVNTCNRIAEAGGKLLDADGKELSTKKFIEGMNSMAEDIGPIPREVILILGDLDNGAAVLHHLAQDNNIDEAEKIWSMSTAKKAMALTKLSVELAKPKNKPKPISKVPEPNKPIQAGASATRQLSDKTLSTKEWIELRNAQIAEKRAARGY